MANPRRVAAVQPLAALWLVNYLFAVGLFVLSLAVWIRFGRRPAWTRFAAFAIMARPTCFAHLFGFALTRLAVAAYEAARATRHDESLRDLLVGCLLAGFGFLPTVVVILVPMPHAGEMMGVAYHDLTSRLTAFAAPVIFETMTNADGAAVLAVMVGRLAAARMLRFNRDLVIVCRCLALAQLAMPDRIMTADGVDHRIPIATILATAHQTAKLCVDAKGTLWLKTISRRPEASAAS